MFKFLFYTNRRINKQMVFVSAMMIVSGIAASLMATTISEIAEDIITDHIANIFYALPLFLALYALLFFSRRTALRSGVNLVERLLESSRNKIGNQLRQSTLIKIENLDQGEIYTKLAVDTKKISRASISYIRGIQSIVIIIIIMLYILSFSIVAGVVFMSMFGIGVFYYQIYYQLLLGQIDEMNSKETELFDNFGHVLDGFKELKLNPEKNEDFYQNYLKPLSKKVKSLRFSIGKKYVDINAFCLFFLHYLILGIIIYIFPLNYSVAFRFKIIAMSVFLFEPIEYLKVVIPEILMAKVSINRLQKLENQLNSTSKLSEYIPHKDKGFSSFHNLQIDALQFKYTDKEGKKTFAIGPINANINAGEIIFLVGGNGSGKSTVLKLISGLYPPFSGSFMVNGKEINMADHRNLFSVVYSDCYIFDKLYGVKNIEDQTVKNLLKLMAIDNKVEWKEKQFHHSGLSTGQTKRLAFIIAILDDRPIYILDEWAAEQDPTFKKKYYTELLPMLKKNGKTIIVATHDDQYYHIADQLLKMDYGQLLYS
ncbi:cyclic peptide transporter [Candidatus Magnetomorum sp. HK-1]|nr:cyclic peptide transporter [Candidatus Magnetomorum sp. HK-1]